MNPHLIHHLKNAAFAENNPHGFRFLDRHENAQFFSWREMWDRAHQHASILSRTGVKPGDRIAIVLPTCIEFMDAFFGAQMLGAVPVPMYPPVRIGRLDEYYQKTAAMLKVVTPVIVISNTFIDRAISKISQSYEPRFGFVNIDSLDNTDTIDFELTSADDLALIQFSSGTTVTPKAVALSHRQTVTNAATISHFVKQHAEPTRYNTSPPAHSGVCWLPLYHDMGLIGCVMSAVVARADLTLIPPEIFLAKPALWLKALSTYRATVSPAPNFAYTLCTQRIKDSDMAGCDLSAWQLALCGAEPISSRAMQEFADRFQQWGLNKTSITPVYGLAEASLAVTFSGAETPIQILKASRNRLSQGIFETDNSDKALELISVGKPLADIKIEIRDDNGHVLSEGRQGQLWISGPSLCDGYFNSDASPIENGWLNSGDLGLIKDGELYITGRAKELIVINGKNHAPQDIEMALDSIDDLRTGRIAAVGINDKYGEKLVVFAEYRKLHEDLANQCHHAILQKTMISANDIILLAPGTLPRTSSGKIRRSESARLWQANKLTDNIAAVWTANSSNKTNTVANSNNEGKTGEYR